MYICAKHNICLTFNLSFTIARKLERKGKVREELHCQTEKLYMKRQKRRAMVTTQHYREQEGRIEYLCCDDGLAIEIGRHHNINRTDRICTFCFNQSNDLHLEDEFHVFFNCLRFDAIRQNLLSPWYRQGSSKQDFFNLMKTENSDIILKLCIYINEILKIKDKEYNILAPIT